MPPLSFYRDVYVTATDVSFSAAPPGHLRVARVADGRCERDTDGTSERFSSGDVFLMSQPYQPYACRSAGMRLDLTGIGLPAVADVTGDPTMSVPGRLQLTGYRPVSPAAARSWNSTVDFVARQLATGAFAASPLITRSTACLLAASALATFPNNAVSDPSPADSRDAHPRTLQRAVAFIDANAAEMITPADIAAASLVTVRAVQLAFRRHLDTTPLAYLRRVRLERAHAELLRADPARTTVTAVAYRWGFPSPSRFAAAYRQTYGIAPGKALLCGKRAFRDGATTISVRGS
jgi:AraC-like DNA-binding protein